jgi:hypothetical protein
MDPEHTRLRERIAYNGPEKSSPPSIPARAERVIARDDSALLLDPQWSADGARLAFSIF